MQIRAMVFQVVVVRPPAETGALNVLRAPALAWAWG